LNNQNNVLILLSSQTMNTTTKKLILISTLLLSFLIIAWCSIDTPEKKDQSSITEYIVDQSDMLDTAKLLDTISTWIISDQEKIWLIQMREEEKLARDVYTTLGEKRWNRIFSNISESEQTHTTAVKNLLDIYSIPDPVLDDSVGKFTSSAMQKLYNDLVSQWDKSLLDALIVGATVEDLDIRDLNVLIKQTDKQDIITIYNNLNKWSRNHLRAYIKNITNNGGNYIPQYISLLEYNEIIWSQQERGVGWMGNRNWR
jgi:hypothetical protein